MANTPKSVTKVGRTAFNPFAGQELDKMTQAMFDKGMGEFPLNALVPNDDGTWNYKRFTLTDVGLIIPDDATEEEMYEAGVIVFSLWQSAAWSVGDWVTKARPKWGSMYDRMKEMFPYAEETLRTYVWLCNKVPIQVRVSSLGPSLHRLVATMDTESQRYWLQEAARHGWKRDEFKRAIEASFDSPAPSGEQDIEEILKEKGKEFTKYSKAITKALIEGDEKARHMALGWVSQQREWWADLEDQLRNQSKK